MSSILYDGLILCDCHKNISALLDVALVWTRAARFWLSFMLCKDFLAFPYAYFLFDAPCLATGSCQVVAG